MAVMLWWNERSTYPISLCSSLESTAAAAAPQQQRSRQQADIPEKLRLTNTVPLKSIEVDLEVRDHVATVVSTLNYKNQEDKPLEAVFVIPLPGDAAVCHFSAQIGQTHIVAELKEKQQAREEYDDALSSGQQAFLLEESEQSPDIFSLSVGSLPPGESASIRLEYVTELAVQADDGLRFCLPAVLNPRYQPRGSEGPRVQVSSVPASLVPYSLSFSVQVSSPRPICKVESSCSLEPLQYLNSDQTQATLKLAAGHTFDRDVEVLIYYKDTHQPTAVVEAGQASAQPGSLMGDPVVMVSLYPEFPQSVMSSLASSGEFVFLMDRSGSMGRSINYSNPHETRITSARDTLLLLLKSLPMGCYFNIYSFWSKFIQMFPESVKYNRKTMEEAMKKVQEMGANLGGTEILQPLQHIYSQPCIPKQPRQSLGASEGCVTVKYSLAGHPFQNQIYFSLKPADDTGLTLHRLAAHSAIRCLESEQGPHREQQDREVKKVVELSVQSGVSSSFTAFIAVNKDNGKPVQGPLVCRNVPTPVSKRPNGTATRMAQVLALQQGFSRQGKPDNGFLSKMKQRFFTLMKPHKPPQKPNAAVVKPPPKEKRAAAPPQPDRDPLLLLISLQKASGFWLLDSHLADVLGKTSEEMEMSKPTGVNRKVYATFLALIWLHGFKMDAKEEWELLAGKAARWIQAENAQCVTECVDAGNKLLGCSVKMEALGF
ncbi:von Willebrand factor A domain-containing protein 5A isoform X5 [Nothobranchius furzeri]|uniref:von Willebrand factor A domain-containing protein 5A isoform X5 n=1 Tax=Nothobranchius furzeri TaxID=105023 RepID=UPI0039049A05